MANPKGNPQNLTPWKPGQSGNPLGRSIARLELDNAFVKALLDDFRTHGACAIRRCREKHAPAYLGVIARILPKELSMEITRADEQSIQHVDRILERFRTMKTERDEAIERLQRLQGSIECQVIDGQQVRVLKNGA